MAFAQETAFKFWGWNTQGDWGPLTFYTSQRHKLVFFAKAPPTTPASELQLIERNNWRSVAWLWRQLTPAQRADWERATKRASLRINGYDLFTHQMTRPNVTTAHTIERNTGIILHGKDWKVR